MTERITSQVVASADRRRGQLCTVCNPPAVHLKVGECCLDKRGHFFAPDEIRKKARVPKNGSVYFTIFQTFTIGTGQDEQALPYFGEYPADFFDLIVIDECQRGGAYDESNWRAILDHFSPAVQLGLTTADNRCSSSSTTTPSPMPWPSWASLSRCGGC